MQFSFKHVCPYCNCLVTSSTPHDHFVTCESTPDIKMKRLKSIETEMDKIFTPPQLRILILAQLKSFYNNIPTKKLIDN